MPRLLSLALLALATPLWAAPAPPPRPDCQKKADAAAWEWSDDRATLAWSVKHAPTTYRLDVIPPAKRFGESAVRFFTRRDKLIHTLSAHHATVFVVKDRVLYYADFSPSATGCSLVAFDLGAKKQLWKTPLKGLGPIAHFRYSNRVTLDLDGTALRVYGKESAGRYVEYVDRKTGKTVGHKQFPRE
jgi:hypothetical protein